MTDPGSKSHSLFIFIIGTCRSFRLAQDPSGFRLVWWTLCCSLCSAFFGVSCILSQPTTPESYASLPRSREINIERGFLQYSKSSLGYRIVYELWSGMGLVNGLKIESTLELYNECKSKRSLEIWAPQRMDAAWASFYRLAILSLNF